MGRVEAAKGRDSCYLRKSGDSVGGGCDGGGAVGGWNSRQTDGQTNQR